jgi:hypothetical protein
MASQRFGGEWFVVLAELEVTKLGQAFGPDHPDAGVTAREATWSRASRLYSVAQKYPRGGHHEVSMVELGRVAELPG